MKKLKPIVATFLLALFSFVSSHALLENFELIHHEESYHSESAPHSDLNHDAADGFCRIDSGVCKIQKSASDCALSQVIATVLAGLLDKAAQREIVLSEHISPPLELISAWQFSSRTALPARAPSIAS